MIEVIFVSTDRGDGTPDNPRRSVDQYWSKDGRLLAESDSLFSCPEAASYMAAERLIQVQRQAEAAEAVLARETDKTPADISSAGQGIEMNDFSLEVALIWARANAEVSVCQTAKNFSASVVEVALEVQRLLIAGEAALATLGSTCVEPSTAHLQRESGLLIHAEDHVQTVRADA